MFTLQSSHRLDNLFVKYFFHVAAMRRGNSFAFFRLRIRGGVWTWPPRMFILWGQSDRVAQSVEQRTSTTERRTKQKVIGASRGKKPNREE
ncbi:hypothetical protein SAMN05444166_6044 [Singulisphaera sp. GP187]|nr:hypothetical protein SAMN05444166_6044 [Singulisphaera sp. GP187]